MSTSKKRIQMKLGSSIGNCRKVLFSNIVRKTMFSKISTRPRGALMTSLASSV
jgi:hypothetical protein